MAGGEGKRLRPLTCKIPKPMVPVMNRPVMEYTFDLLKKHNIKNAGVTLQYLPNEVKNHFGDNYNGINIEYFVENTPLGTAGSVFSAGDYADGCIVVMSGDALCDIDLTQAIEFHKKNHSIATLVLKSVDNPMEYGVVLTNEDGSINRFIEKPDISELFGNLVNTGIYILEKEAFEGFDKNKKFDFSKDVFPKLLEEGKPIFGFISESYWCDIGSIDQYMQAHRDIFDGKVNLDIKANKYGNIYVQQGAIIDNTSILKGPCFIGKGSKILSSVAVEPYSVIGANCMIDNNTSLKRSILWKNVNLSRNCEIRGAIICDQVNIFKGCSVFENCIVSSNASLGEGCQISDGAKVWPEKSIKANSKINDDYIWGNKEEFFSLNGIFAKKELFTPEIISHLGKAIASSLPQSGSVAISHDGSLETNMIKYALAAGILAGGGDVCDCEKSLFIVLKHAVKALNLNAGIYIQLIEDKIKIEFIDSDARIYDKTKIKNLTVAFEQTSAHHYDDMGILAMRLDMTQFYIASLVKKIKVDNMKKNPQNIILVDSGNRENDLIKTIFSQFHWNVEIVKDVEQAKNLHRRTNALAFMIQNDKLQLITSNNDIKDEMLDLFFAYIDLENGEKELFVDAFAPETIETIAQSYDATIKRVHSREILNSPNMNSFLYMYKQDIYYTIIMLCNWFEQQKCSIDDCAAKLPFLQTQSKNIKLELKHVAKVFKHLNDEKPYKDHRIQAQSEGLKIATKDGWVHIVPRKDEIRILASSFSEEYAESLADIYSKRIKKISLEGEQ